MAKQSKVIFHAHRGITDKPEVVTITFEGVTSLGPAAAECTGAKQLLIPTAGPGCYWRRRTWRARRGKLNYGGINSPNSFVLSRRIIAP